MTNIALQTVLPRVSSRCSTALRFPGALNCYNDLQLWIATRFNTLLNKSTG